MAAGECAPGSAFLIFDATRLPNSNPIRPGIGDFGFRQDRIEGIDPAVVRINTDPQLINWSGAGNVYGLEACFQPDRHQKNRNIIVETFDALTRIRKLREPAEQIRFDILRP